MLNQFSKDRKKNNFPQIMGIVNVTDDSFSDGGKFNNINSALNHSIELINRGADIIDIGGESTRPGAMEIELKTELERTIPLIKEIRKVNQNIKISIDTTKYEVAKQALENGANIINDISGLNFEPRFIDLAKEFKAELIIMHIQGTPRTMQINPTYKNILNDIYIYFEERIALANNCGLDNLTIDVGIGFGKTLEDNITLLKNLNHFEKLKAKKMIGISRKSFIGKLFDIENPTERDLESTLIHSFLLKENIDILRVHNVKAINSLKKAYQIFG